MKVASVKPYGIEKTYQRIELNPRENGLLQNKVWDVVEDEVLADDFKVQYCRDNGYYKLKRQNNNGYNVIFYRILPPK